MCSKCHGTGYKEEWVPIEHVWQLMLDLPLMETPTRIVRRPPDEDQSILTQTTPNPPEPPPPDSDPGVVIKEGGWPPKS